MRSAAAVIVTLRFLNRANLNIVIPQIRESLASLVWNWMDILGRLITHPKLSSPPENPITHPELDHPPRNASSYRGPHLLLVLTSPSLRKQDACGLGKCRRPTSTDSPRIQLRIIGTKGWTALTRRESGLKPYPTLARSANNYIKQHHNKHGAPRSST